MEKVLVTGAGGYIGSRIYKYLAGKGYRVTGIDRVTAGMDGFQAGEGVEVLEADITDPSTFSGSYKEVDILVHCAALVHNKSQDLSRGNYFKINLDGTKNIVSFLDETRLKQVVFLSTVSVYGDAANAREEDPRLLPLNYYGESKLAAEKYLEEFREKTKVPYTIFRPVSVYGRDFLQYILKRVYLPGKTAFYRVGSGEQKISLCSIKNLVKAVHASLLDQPFFNRTYILKDREDYSLNQVIAAFKALNDHGKRPVLPLPKFVFETAFKALKLVLPGKGAHLLNQFRKISRDYVYPLSLLPPGCENMEWNLKKTLALPGEYV